MAHFAIRSLIHEAALKADEDPGQLSFLHAVRVVRRRLPTAIAVPPLEEKDFPSRRPQRNPPRTRRIQPKPAKSSRRQAQDEQLPAPPPNRPAASRNRHRDSDPDR